MAESRIIAFAGDGVTTVENARAVLNNWLPETVEVEGFIVPENIKARTQKGLAAVVTYLTEDWGDDASEEDPYESVPAHDLVQELIDYDAKGAGRYLIVILGDAEPDDQTIALVDYARVNDVTVLDLAAGLDEYTADDQREETPATAPEPEPARGARRRRGAAAEEPAAAPETPARASRTRGKPRTTEEVSEIGTKALDSLAEKRAEAAAAEDKPPFDGPYKAGVNVGANGRLVHVTPLPSSPPLDEIRSVIREELAAMLSDALQAVADHVTVTFDGTTIGYREAPVQTLPASIKAADGPTAAYIKAEDGKLRKRGRGKPRSGEEEVWLTASQAEAKGLPF